MKTSVAVVIALFASQAANAQTKGTKSADELFGPALNQLGIYLTGPVADSYRRAAAAKFSDGAVKAGFNSVETKSFSASMVSGEIRFGPQGSSDWIYSRDAALPPGEKAKAGYLLSFASVESATTFLVKYSTIKLLVKPAPPRDYKVIVNGEECPATEAGIYKVMPGESAVKVSRPSKPECEWRGSIGPAGVQEIDCSLLGRAKDARLQHEPCEALGISPAPSGSATRPSAGRCASASNPSRKDRHGPRYDKCATRWCGHLSHP